MRSFIRIFFITCQLFIIVLTLKAQTSPPVSFPQVTPPSPEAASLGKYGDLPVGMFTGHPNINIPLYQVSTKHLSVPIGLNYNVNGIKVNELSSNVGMSWALNCGGVISRTVYGYPDFNTLHQLAVPPPTFSLSTSNPDAGTLAWMNGVATNGMDTQVDAFNFNFNGYSGKFFIVPQGPINAVTYSIVTIPYSNIKIQYDFTRSDWNFKLTTPDGVMYYFGGSSATENVETINNCGTGHPGTVPSAWYLTKIQHPYDASDSLHFSYLAYNYQYSTGLNQTETYWDGTNTYNPSGGLSCGPSPYIYGLATRTVPQEQFCTTSSVIMGVYLQNITDGKYNQLVMDYVPKTDANGGYLLRHITVNNNQTGLKIKSFSFNYQTANPISIGNTGSANNTDASTRLPRPFLTEVDELDNSGNVVKPYLFGYNDFSQLPPRLSFAQDYWGYYNGIKTNYASFIPLPPAQAQLLVNSSLIANRNPDYTYASMGLLNKITYPTGGYTTIQYEGNTTNTSYQGATDPSNYVSFSNSQIPGTNSLANSAGGMRVQRVVSYDPVSNTSIIKKYLYDAASAKFPAQPTYYHHLTHYEQQWDMINCIPMNGIVHAGFHQFSSSSFIDAFGQNSSPVYYQKVTEVFGDNYENGAIEHDFSYNAVLPISTVMNEPVYSATAPPVDWRNGLELATKQFKMVNGVQVPVQNKTRTYQVDSRNSTSFNQYVIEMVGNMPTSVYTYLQVPCYNVAQVNYISEWQYLSSESVQDFDINGNPTVSVTNNYYYDNPSHALLTREQTIDSKGILNQQFKRYPQDNSSISSLTSSETTALSNLISQGRIGELIEEEKDVNAALTQRVHYTYNSFSPSLVLPQSIQVQNGPAGTPFTVMSFNTYDAYGNILERQKANDFKEVYLWGYNYQYPVAKIVGSNYTTVSGLISQSQIDAAVNSNDDPTLRTALNTFRTSLNNLGTNLNSAQVTTYTYKPLIGMTSQTDPAGRTNYYEYDNFNRLRLIRDQNNNILKKFCYNYAGQSTTCIDNVTTPPPPPATIYVRLSYENISYGYNITVADIVARFYSDAAGTQPMNVSNLTVAYGEYTDCDQSSYTGTGTANGTSIVLVPYTTIYNLETICDPYSGACNTLSCNMSFFLNSGNYVIIQ